MNPKHRGSTFDDFLKEEGLYEEVQALAIKKIIALEIAALMKKQRLTKERMAKKMRTSRTQLDRLLDPLNTSVTLTTLTKAAAAVGQRVRIELVHT